MRKKWKQWQNLFSWAPKSLQTVTYSHEIKRCLLFGRKAMANLDTVLNSRGVTLSKNVHRVKAMVFAVVMLRCERWATKKGECRRINAFELWCWRRLWESLGLQGDQTVYPKGNPSGLFIGKTDAEGEASILRPPEAKDWRWKEKGTTEDKIVGWHHQLNGHDFEPTPLDSEGQGNLMCCISCGGKESSRI